MGKPRTFVGVLPLVDRVPIAVVGLLFAPRRALTPSAWSFVIVVVRWHSSAVAPRCGRMLATWWSKLSWFR